MAQQAFHSAFDVIRGSTDGDAASGVAQSILGPFNNNSRFYTNDPSRAVRSSGSAARAADPVAAALIPTSSPSPSSGYSAAAGFDGGASMGYASAVDASERPWSSIASLYGMDNETAYQEALASTAHQREVADLRAAGLNPVLSATGGNGAAVFSGTAAPVLGTGSGGSSGYSPGSGRDGSSIAERIGSLNWSYALPDLLSGAAQTGIAAATHNRYGTMYGISSLGRGLGKLFS